MSSDVVIRAEGLGKSYLIGHLAERERYLALRDVLARGARNLRRSTLDLLSGRPMIAGDQLEEFWALKNIDFEIRRGDVVGIIGRNGAGKSTLLKILSRITEPTQGRVTVAGRVASLLEVGTGFHPELSGRENIYLNGAILGMTRAEIKRRFDEIVAFADIARFLDTPVKRYSSGMYVRLAFAVAAHLEPDILVVDEVLAVGDAEFQKKCLGKMSEVARGGRTLLFVSHNMAAVEALCPRSILLEGGMIASDGPSESVVAEYVNQRRVLFQSGQIPRRAVQDDLVIENVRLSPSTPKTNGPLDVAIDFKADGPGCIHECQLLIYALKGSRISAIDLREHGLAPLRYEAGEFTVTISISSLPIVEIDITLGLYLVTDRFADDLLDLVDCAIAATNTSSSFAPYSVEHRGVLTLSSTSSVSTHPHGPTKSGAPVGDRGSAR
jgi:ABC-type polysaccharide/polyol phosphate transport system ATPase subunit